MTVWVMVWGDLGISVPCKGWDGWDLTGICVFLSLRFSERRVLYGGTWVMGLEDTGWRCTRVEYQRDMREISLFSGIGVTGALYGQEAARFRCFFGDLRGNIRCFVMWWVLVSVVSCVIVFWRGVLGVACRSRRWLTHSSLYAVPLFGYLDTWGQLNTRQASLIDQHWTSIRLVTPSPFRLTTDAVSCFQP